MWGADTSLVVDALQIGALALAAGAGGTWLLLKRRKSAPARQFVEGAESSLEKRVQVLERIATDRPSDLAEQIERLRDEETAAPESVKRENA
ncbi:hypothetical protein N8940_02295 [Sphingomonadaceae bacterium]|nr:hypothetical protein [Sphingomonadaceae bacterium]